MTLPALKTVTKTPNEINRRGFLKSGGAAVTLTLAPGITVMAFGGEAAAAANPATRYGLLIDVNKCDKDCTACVSGCAQENGWKMPDVNDTDASKTDAQWIRKVDLTHKQTGRKVSMPMMCQHCENPPCVDVCPTGASFKRVDGIVLVDKHLCIGCRYCMMACPFKARSFVHEDLEDQKSHAPRGKGTVESCTLCVHRVDQGGIPACVEACDATGHGAMIFGDLNDPSSDIAIAVANHASIGLREDLRLNTAVRYSNL